jgi:hypothetical protein
MSGRFGEMNSPSLPLGQDIDGGQRRRRAT